MTGEKGMDLRDYFAAAAVQGFCANNYYSRASVETLVDNAYAVADAMMKAREHESA
jgi:hypothetical protein